MPKIASKQRQMARESGKNPGSPTARRPNDTRAGDDRRGLIRTEDQEQTPPDKRGIKRSYSLRRSKITMTEYTDFHTSPQAPCCELRQDLPCISFDPLGDVATIAAVEGADGCEAVVTLLNVATIAAVEKGDGCEASATLLDAFLEKARGADAQRAQQPKKLYFLYTDEAGTPL